MNVIEVPVELQPTGSINQAIVKPKLDPLAVDESIKKMDRYLEKAGLVKLNVPTMRLIHSLGVEAEIVGVLNLNRGYGVLTQQALLNAITKMTELMENTKDEALKAKTGYAIGYVSEKLGRLCKTMIDSEHADKASSEVNNPMPVATRRRSFLPGSIVANSVHIHPPAEAPTAQ